MGLDNVDRWRQALPPELFALVERWAQSLPCTLRLRGPFIGGRSGVPVLLVEWPDSDNHKRLICLKFCRGAERSEAIQTAYSDAPPKFRTHLVELLDVYPLGDDWTAVTLSIAGGDLGTFRPLSEIRTAAGFADALERIVESLHGLNPEFKIAEYTTGAFLTRLLGDRQSTIRDRVTRLGVGPHNLPLALLDDDRLARHQLESVLVGRVHGDLNGGNIAVPARPRIDPDRFVLLDPDHYSKDGPLAYDMMHLLVAIAINVMLDARIGTAGRDDLIRIIVDPDARPTTSSAAVIEFQHISQAVHRGCDARALSRGYGHDWRVQKLLALVAIGLIHVARDLPGDDPDTDWRWCLNLATEAAKAYLAAIGQDNWYVPATQSPTVTSEVRSTWNPRPGVTPPAEPVEDVTTNRPDSTTLGAAAPALSTNSPKWTRLRRIRRRTWLLATITPVLLMITAGIVWADPLGGPRYLVNVRVLSNPDELVTIPALSDAMGNYVTRLSIAAVPPPPDQRDSCVNRYRWAHSEPIDAIDAGTSVAKIDITARDKDIKVDRADIAYANSKSDALAFTLLACPGRGGSVPPHLMQADLDLGKITFFPNGGDTPGNFDLRIKRGHTESILLIGYALNSFAQWRLELGGDDLGENSFAITVGPQGSVVGRAAANLQQRPFETTGELAATPYRFRDGKWQPGR
jgi:hypothetical protein